MNTVSPKVNFSSLFLSLSVNDCLRFEVCAEVRVGQCLMFVFEMCDEITSVLLSIS